MSLVIRRFGLIRGFEENVNGRCSLLIGNTFDAIDDDHRGEEDESLDRNDGHHHTRRMVSSVNFNPRSCNKSEAITIDIPHANKVQRSFTKISFTEAKSRMPSSQKNIFKSGNGDDVNSLSQESQYLTWEGQDSLDGSTFTFIQDSQSGDMAGSLVDLTNHEVYQFYNQHDGSMSVTIIKSDDFYPEIEPENPTPTLAKMKRIQDNQEHGSNRNLRASPSYAVHQGRKDQVAAPMTTTSTQEDSTRRSLLSNGADDGSILDVMVVWTAQAECRRSDLAAGCTLSSQTHSNMMNLVNLAIAETNIAYSASGVKTQLQLVHAYRHPSYDEKVGGMQAALRNISRGFMSGVHDNRANYGADIVSLIVDDTQYCGIAYVGPRFDLMYSVIHWSCATGYYSFGHEIGHNLGLHHDRGSQNECRTNIEQYNYGYRDPNANFRTIMAYNCKRFECDFVGGDRCTRIARFSNPSRTFHGSALGTQTEDAARAINDVRKKVARYYPHGGVSNTLSPTASPRTQSPTAASSSTESPTESPTASCNDSTLRFEVHWQGMQITRDCSWVAARATSQRCAANGVSAMCSKTCNKCSTWCNDSSLRFKVDWNNKTMNKDCNWVRNKATSQRCNVDGVPDACRSTCGLC